MTYRAPAQRHVRFPSRRTVLVALGIACILGVTALAVDRVGRARWRKRVEPLAFDSNAVRVGLTRDGQKLSLAPMFVGVAAIDRRHIALVDYAHLYCLELDSGSLKPAAPILERDRQPPMWVPTGLAYDNARQRLFVANYLGNQVYEGMLDCDRGVFSIVAGIASRDTISPENVALSNDGATLAVASYDGNNITAFRRARSGDWRSQWTFALAAAHGVAILGDQVFATGLAGRELVRIDLTSGARTGRVGSLGWNPWAHQMLWPTSVLARHGQLVLSDAHTGLVCLLDPSRLQAQRCFGGNGPLAEHLNMPYSVAALGDDLLVASTFQGRVLVVRLQARRGASILADYAASFDGWKEIDGLVARHSWPSNAGLPSYRWEWEGNGYLRECELAPPLHGLRCGYGELQRGARRMQLPLMTGLLNQCGYYYFVEAYRGREGTILFSPQNKCVVYVWQGKHGEVGLLSRQVSQGGWRVGNWFVSPGEVLSLESMEQEFLSTLSRIDDIRVGSVLLPRDAARLFFPGVPDDADRLRNLQQKLAAVLTSEKGASFVRLYLGCTDGSCPTEELGALAMSGSQDGDAEGNLESAFLPCFLAGARCLSRQPAT